MDKTQERSNSKSIANPPNAYCIQVTGSDYFYVTAKAAKYSWNGDSL